MRLKFRFLTALTALIFYILPAFGNSNITIYVNNQPYDGECFIYKGEVFVRLDEIIPALNMTLINNSDKFYVFRKPPVEIPNVKEENSNALVFIEGISLMDGVSQRKGKVWVKVSSLGRSLGFFYNYNLQTQIVDLTAPPDRGLNSVKPETKKSGPNQDNLDSCLNEADMHYRNFWSQNCREELDFRMKSCYFNTWDCEDQIKDNMQWKEDYGGISCLLPLDRTKRLDDIHEHDRDECYKKYPASNSNDKP